MPSRGDVTTRRPGTDQPTRSAESGRIAGSDANRLGWSLFPVRLFLGLTFVYGGVQKLSDPGFLHPGAPTYIGTQLHGFANGTPGGFLLRAFAIPHPAISGLGVALAEIAIGLLVTTGLLVRPAAAAGLALNLLLFLTNSWHTYPYFLGSDIVFVFAWLPFVVAGASRQPTVEPMLHRLLSTWAPDGGRGARLDRHGAGPSRSKPIFGEPETTRRSFVGAALSVAGASTAVIAGLSVLARGSYRSPRTLRTAAPRHTPTPSKAGTKTQRAVRGLPSGAVKLGAASQLPAGQGATYADPGDGNPDIVIRQSNGTLVAHSAVCTHAGCTVGYQGGQILCPCHGAVYNAQTGAVISGPAPSPLAPRKVLERDGEIYALPT